MKKLKRLNLFIALLEWPIKMARRPSLFFCWMMGWVLFGTLLGATLVTHEFNGAFACGAFLMPFSIPILGGLMRDETINSLKRERFKLVNGYEPYDPVI